MLTDDEIDKLERRALDAAVAEHVLGWTWREYPEIGRILANTHDEEWVRSGVVIENGKAMYVDNLPRYSTDWAAVGALLDRVSNYVINYHADLFSEAIIDGFVVGRGTTPQLAICRAALKAIAAQGK